jgi:uncharacterized protein
MRVRPRTGAALAGAGAAAAVAAYSLYVEPRWLEVTHPRIHLRKLPPVLEGLRIALLTDLHAGGGTPLALIRRACTLAMRERPHLIAVTGDFVDDRAGGFRAVLNELDLLRAPLGVYAVPGNHDHIVGIETWHRDVRAHPGITDLTNAAVVLPWRGVRICVAGVDDLSRGTPHLDALPPPDERDLTILLAHDPDQAERARRAYDRVELVVSGHTHGGQVRLPGIGALRNPAERKDLYIEGLRRRPWTQVYTSRGIGNVHLPIRFLCRPEVAMLHLTATPRPAKRYRSG